MEMPNIVIRSHIPHPYSIYLRGTMDCRVSGSWPQCSGASVIGLTCLTECHDSMGLRV